MINHHIIETPTKHTPLSSGNVPAVTRQMNPLPLVTAPSFEHHPTGLGVHHSQPRISWRFAHSSPSSPTTNWSQSSYAVEIKPSSPAPPLEGRRFPRQSEVYHVQSAESVLVCWPGAPLRSREAVSVRVRAFGGGRGEEAWTEWSPWSEVEAALFESGDWTAGFIAAAEQVSAADGAIRPVRLRRKFEVGRGVGVVRARLYITAMGVYKAYINGKRVGDYVLAPGWTSYSHRMHYQVFDVGGLLQHGKNILAVEVGAGWFAGRFGLEGGKRGIYGKELGVMAQLEIQLDGKEVLRVDTEEQSWECMKSAILTAEIYDGEVYDMREERAGWNDIGVQPDQISWEKVKELQFPAAKLVAPDAPPVRVTEEIKPLKVFTSKSGKTIVDFGQNLVGVVRVHSLTTPPGHEVSLLHAEVLEDGELATRPLRTAKCKDTIISSGDTLQNWNPKYTFHGFRYVQVDGWPGIPKKENFTALVIHTDMRRRGWFSCSDPLVNKLHQNVVWGMRGNFLSIPTDCPQRDERLGWTGDIQVFCSSATFIYDTVGMLSNWLEDVSAEQLAKENGIPGLVVPDILPPHWKPTPQAVWHDVVVLTPWDLYSFSGDLEILRRQYSSMKAWIDKAISRGPDGLWNPDIWQLGDWLDPAAPPSDPGNSRTDGVFVADAYLVHITSTFSLICSVLSLSDEAGRYAADAAKLKSTFQHKYITPHGLLVNNTQTAMSLAINFGLYSGTSTEQLTTAASNLGRLVRNSQFRISTGFAGTPVICHALTATRQTQVAYRMLLEKHCPSWLYPVTMGATTVWERWDSMLPDGTVNKGSMTSFNHYALGAVASWLHSTVGGISSDDGWRTVKVTPVPGGSIDHAEVFFDGPYGDVCCRWKTEGKIFKLEIEIPPNSTAMVTLPDTQGSERHQSLLVGSGHHSFSCDYEAEQWPPARAPEAFWGTWMCDCCK